VSDKNKLAIASYEFLFSTLHNICSNLSALFYSVIAELAVVVFICPILSSFLSRLLGHKNLLPGPACRAIIQMLRGALTTGHLLAGDDVVLAAGGVQQLSVMRQTTPDRRRLVTRLLAHRAVNTHLPSTA